MTALPQKLADPHNNGVAPGDIAAGGNQGDFSEGTAVRIPRFRFTIRWMMVAVAIVAVALGMKVLNDRASGYRSRASDHRLEAEFHNKPSHMEMMKVDGTLLDLVEPPNLPRVEFHNRMSRKYARAARYPWLPVEPDPPGPERD